jgi:hypothetical protein
LFKPPAAEFRTVGSGLAGEFGGRSLARVFRIASLDRTTASALNQWQYFSHRSKSDPASALPLAVRGARRTVLDELVLAGSVSGPSRTTAWRGGLGDDPSIVGGTSVIQSALTSNAVSGEVYSAGMAI